MSTSPPPMLEKLETHSLFSSAGHSFHHSQFNFPKFASQDNGLDSKSTNREDNECCQAVSKMQYKLSEHR